MNIPLIDLKRQYEAIKSEIDDAVLKVIRSGEYILSSEVSDFESEFSNFCGTKFAVGVSSGTAALELALAALGVDKGTEVVVPAFTFYATASSVCYANAKPVFVDVDIETANMDLNMLEDAVKKSNKVRVVIPVHLYGQPVDMESLLKIAERYNLWVIEDAAQAHGAEVSINGVWKKVGSIGKVGCFSFYPAKNLGAYGDAGIVTTNDENLCQRMRMLRDCGRREKYTHEILAYNARLDSIQAAILRVKLKKLEEWNRKRREIANLYDRLLDGVVEPIKVLPFAKPVYHMYVVRVKERDRLREYLLKMGIMTGIHYPFPLHLQLAFSFLGYKAGDFPNAEKLAREVISLPMFPEIKKEEIEYVVDCIKKFYA